MRITVEVADSLGYLFNPGEIVKLHGMTTTIVGNIVDVGGKGKSTPAEAARGVANFYGCAGTRDGDLIQEAFTRFANLLEIE